MSKREAGELISVSVLVSCTWRRLGGREREAHENYPLLLSYIHCGRDNLNEKIWGGKVERVRAVERWRQTERENSQRGMKIVKSK